MTHPRELRQSCEEGILLNGEASPPREEAPDAPPRSRRQDLSIILPLFFVNFWMAASFSLQAPFFPQEAELKGATPTQYGLVFGVFELSTLIVSPVFGKLIPRYSPKFLITSGVLVGGVACCVFGILDYVPAGNYYISLAFIVRIFEGCGAAAMMTASFTIVATAFPDNVATSFSFLETGFGAGMIVGPTIGGALFQAGGFILPFIVNGGFLIAGCVLLAFLLPSDGDAGRQGGSRNLWKFLFDGGIISYTLTIVSTQLIIGFNAATLEPHLRQFNLEPIVLGLVFIITGSIYALTTPIFGIMISKGVDPLFVSIAGYVMTSIGILFIGPTSFIQFQPTLGTVIGCLVVIGLGVSAKLISSFVGILKNTMERGFPNDVGTYGMVSALFSMAFSTGAFIGPSIGGLLLDTTGYRAGTIVIFSMDIVLLLILVSYVLYTIGKKKDAPKDTCEREPLLTSSYAARPYMYTSV